MPGEFRKSLSIATISFSLEGSEVSITDFSLTLSFDNGCSYQEVMGQEGKKSYMLQKGSGVQTVGSATIGITKTPDGKYDDAISSVQDAEKDAQDNDNPESYTKSLTFSFGSAGDKNFMSVSFSGYVKEVKANVPEGNQFPQYNAEIVVTDPETVAIQS